MSLDVSLAICTLQRADSLARALASVEATTRGAAGFEVLVVDNGSTDATGDVVSGFAARMPLRYLVEPHVGLSRARNLALAEARGELLVFFDDDVEPEPGWLEAYRGAARAFPAVAYFGGAIVPEFEVEAPAWIARSLSRLGCAFGVAPDAVPARSVDFPAMPFGANFAIRIAACRGLTFDVELGRRGKGRLSFEETEFLWRLHARGGAGRWLPEAVVRHHVPRQRLSLVHVWRFFVGFGRSYRVMGRLDEFPRVRGLPAPLRRPALVAKSAWLSARAAFDWARGSERWTERLCTAGISLGLGIGRGRRKVIK